MPVDPCFPYPALANPPSSSASLKFLVGIDANGNQRILAVPSNEGLLYFNKTDIFFVDGHPSKALKLPNMWRISGVTGNPGEESGLLVYEENIWKRLVNESTTKKVVKLGNGRIYLENDKVGLLLPEEGSGVAVRDDEGNITWHSFNGLIYVDEDGNVQQIGLGGEGEMLVIKGGVPTFVSSGGSIASGSTVTNLETVKAQKVSDSSANIKIPKFTLSNGVDEVTVDNVNVTVDFAGGNGLLALDVGAEAADKWYYVYITSDGLGDVSAIISESPVEPDLSATDHTYFAFASILRNVSGNIYNFLQRGRRFSHEFRLWGNNLSINSTFNTVNSGTALTTLVPPMVTVARGVVGGSTTETTERRVIMASDSSGLGYFPVAANEEITTSFDSFKFDIGTFEVFIKDPDAPAIYWKQHTGSSNRRRIGIHGFDI